jgi:hypothetical protein
MAGTVVTLSTYDLSVKVTTDEAGLCELCQLPILGRVVVMRAEDWQQTVDVMQAGTSQLVALEIERAQLRADIERLGRERDDMARANAELQERLSAYERRKDELPTPQVPPPGYAWRSHEDDLK